MNNDKKYSNLFPCPCCNSRVFTMRGGYEICNVCGWEDDPAQSADPALQGGANELSLEMARKVWIGRRKEESRESLK
jgi:hypothetical protein